MTAIVRSKQFKKDLKTIIKRNIDIETLVEVVNMLVKKEKLPNKYLDHPLKGQFVGFRECHLDADWLLIYSYEKDMLFFGSHSDLF